MYKSRVKKFAKREKRKRKLTAKDEKERTINLIAAKYRVSKETVRKISEGKFGNKR